MSWIQLAVATPAFVLIVAVCHDFLAGLGEERLWSDPAVEDPISYSYRTAVAELERRQQPAPAPELAGYAAPWDLFVPVPQS